MQMTSFKEMIIETIQSIEDNTLLFYQQKEKEGYEKLESTFTMLIQTVNGILETKSKNNDIYIDEKVLNSILSNAMNAIKLRDTVLLSDILYFDLKPLLEQCYI